MFLAFVNLVNLDVDLVKTFEFLSQLHWNTNKSLCDKFLAAQEITSPNNG
jgi:hypothetical protein